MRIALNSSTELEYHLITGLEVGMIRHPVGEELLNRTIEVRRMLYGLLRKLNTSTSSSKLSAS